MDKISTSLILDSTKANVNVNGYNAELTFYNINYKNLLGDDYELGADYNLILKNVTTGLFTIISTRRGGTIRIMGGGALLFNNSGDKNIKRNQAIYMFNANNTGPVTLRYCTWIYQTFKLTREYGNIDIIIANQLTDYPLTASSYPFLFFFDIVKITNKIPKPLLFYTNVSRLVLSSYEAEVDVNNVSLTWRNIYFKTLLGDLYELNSTYNIVLKSCAVNETSVTASNRVGHLEVSSNCLVSKYNTSNKWLIPFNYTSTTPNAQHFKGVYSYTCLMNGEQGDITMNHYTQHFYNNDTSVLLAEKILYFDIYKL